LFLLDEVARLGYMGVLEQARDAGRKYGITLLLLYQSLGQLVGQWGREGKQAGTTRPPGACSPPSRIPTPRRNCPPCVANTRSSPRRRVNSVGSQSRGRAFAASSSGWSENRSEIRRALIKPEEII
ncbi:MAG TPA: type IV secretory system conjugative DNA transfer family protein, partial [Acetobacteraceae bacterium]|nr:type IV secretory system conjugative DNA transfer family protein [Acetobacteraceae bacterium]